MFEAGRRNGHKTVTNESIKIDDAYIVKEGYLVKSPPLHCIKNRVARWHMRWFILYDTQPHCDVDPAVDKEVGLLYYRNSESRNKGDIPLGRINMIGAEVSIHRASIHGYPFVINMKVVNRTYYLCATQFYVFNEWLQKLKKHLPSPSLLRRSPLLCEIGTHTSVNRTKPIGSIRREACTKCKKLTDAEYKFTATSTTQVRPQKSPPFIAAVSFFEPSRSPYRTSNDKCRDCCTDCEIYDGDFLNHTASSQSFHQEFQRTQQLHLKPKLRIMPASLVASDPPPAYDNCSTESDEGIVCTSSESSITEPASMLSQSMSSFTAFRTTFDWNDMGVFVGPKLPHSFSTVCILKDSDTNNNNRNHRNHHSRSNNHHPSNNHHFSNNYNHINNSKEYENAKHERLPLSRVKSRSLDSINKMFTELNVSTIFDEDIDEMFPPLCYNIFEDRSM